LEFGTNRHDRHVGVERGGESHVLYRTEEYFLRFIVDGKTTFPGDIQTHNPINPVAECLLQEREVFRKNRKGLDTNRAKK
jgi:hypothetical protein